jgi:hypothetical protein
MSPLEAMAKAWHDHRNKDLGGFLLPWKDIPEPAKAERMSRMRAALIALAECDLPEEVKKAGFKESPYDGEPNELDGIANVFRAMLRSIADQKDGEEK